jgi:DNA invertase Pin-like site-specific DNA recombinase
VQKEPLSKELHTRSELIRVGQAKARVAGRVGGRRARYPDAVIREAIRRHDSGETWAAAATALGISVDWLYARVRKLRRENANAKDT